MRFVVIPFCACCASLWLVSCGAHDQSSINQQPQLFESRDIPIDAFRVAYNKEGVSVYSGGEPTADGALEHLASLGVTTVISVDATTPDADAIESLGMRSVHVPIGYSSVPRECQASVAKAIRETNGAVFIHCHHGLHRGPTATAAGLISLGYMTPSEGLTFMRQAGTSESYEGLYRSIERAAEIEDETISSAELVRIAEVKELAAQMAEVDRVFENLERIAANDWKVLPDHPDLSAVSESGQLTDLFRLIETGEGTEPPDEQYEALMKLAFTQATLLEHQIGTGKNQDAAGTLGELRQTCKSCHAAHR
ncbi:MAG: hypothetical protein Phyf2KO_22060 [Phycisphaerales bacterium]